MKVATSDYRALAALRYLLRQFLCEADSAAHRIGLEPQQFQLLLAVRGLPEGFEPTVQTLAERLALRHNTTVELIDRMEQHRYVTRTRKKSDRRAALVSLLPEGERLLEQVARQRLTEVRAGGTALLNALNALLGRNHNRHRARRASHGNQRFRQKAGQP